MIKNYFKIALRTLFRNKVYSIINVAGLTFGISCFLLIGLYLFDELTFDRQYSNSNRIYRVVEHKSTKGEMLNSALTSYKLAEESKKTIAEIDNTTRLTQLGRDNVLNPENQVKFYQTLFICDPNLLKVFDFSLLEGNRNTALSEPNSIVITKELALKLFNSTNVVGKTLYAGIPLKITGVLENHPKNSSFDFSLLISESTYSSAEWYKEMVISDWSSNGFSVFALLKENTNPESVSEKVTKFIKSNYKPEKGTTVVYSLQPLSEMHLYSESITDNSFNKGNLLYIYIFAIAAIFVLLIACINYMNLTTARASNRSKEIGVRKVNGAFRSDLIYQFLFESLLLTFISFLLSIVFVNLLLPGFNQFTGKQLSLNLVTDYRIWIYIIGFVAVIGFLSGSYPALILSRFKPVSLLKGLKLNKSGLSLRKSLVVFQFSISTVMIIATMVLVLQVRFANNKNLGFNKGQLVVVDINSGTVRKRSETIKNEFRKIPGVKSVSISSRVPGEWKDIPTVKIKIEGNTAESKVAYLIGADEDFARTFEINFLEGKSFANMNDSSSIIINETAAKLLNIDHLSGQLVEIPSKAFGGSYFPLNHTFKARIIGIVKDFHFQSLHEKIAPLVLAYQYNPVHNIDYFTSRLEGKDIPAMLKKMESVLAKTDPDHLFEYHFLDERLAFFYIEDQRREAILIWVAFASIFIACLGLFGLATYSTEQRTKEIGVRKVLGASEIHLATLLSKDFMQLVLIANVIAFPLAWWVANRWLQEFAYHIQISWWIFASAGILALIIALATVSFQAIKAALANPVKSLRTE